MSKRVRGESRGQHEPTWVRIRGLIDRYPNDSGILKELIQNADDGGAREVKIILDEAKEFDGTMPYPELKTICGPAIMAYNDAPFKESDFTNLQNLANSSKGEDAFKTGRFGLGFNAVYNITDYPILLSTDRLWLLDPCDSVAKNSAGGEQWYLKELIANEVDEILKLFEPVGYRCRQKEFQATAFRLPLRTPVHRKLNHDPVKNRAKISDRIYSSEDFEQLVSGLSKIGHELLLFLKNVESVGCFRRRASGKLESLLEISITNVKEFRAGRESINTVLRSSLEAVLEAAADAEDGKIESCYEARVSVCKLGSVETSVWQIASGLYAGDDGCLVMISSELAKLHERGLPHAGVAVCTSRGTQRFPKIDGKVFCYLPIADKDYSGKFPVHIHGAFSLDDSRTSLTGHREDEHGKAEVTARWNDLLLEHGVARAYATVLTALTVAAPQSANSPAQMAGSIYKLFPPPPSSQQSHFSTLATAVCVNLAFAPVFLDVVGNWQTTEDLFDVPNDLDLEWCLEQEDFSFAKPRIPRAVRAALEEVEGLPPDLTISEIRDHFCCDKDFETSIAKAPFQGLRKKEAILALFRFVLNQAETDFDGLPLALGSDAILRRFKDDVPIYACSARQLKILLPLPDRMLHPDIAGLLQNVKTLPSAVGRLEGETLLELIEEIYTACEDPEIPTLYPSHTKGIPNADWLRLVLEELCAFPEDDQPSKERLREVSLIPDSLGRLHRPGMTQTPLVVSAEQKELLPVLTALQVSHFPLVSQQGLSKALKGFQEIFQDLWDLTAPDLIDTLDGNLEILAKTKKIWAKAKIVNPLMRFLGSWVEEAGSEDPERLQKLRKLPIFEDQEGNFDVVGDDCFILGRFDPPEFLTGVKILKTAGRDRLFEILEVEELTRRALLESWILTQYAEQTPERQREWLRWIRDEWNHLVTEWEDGSAGLREALCNEDIIFTTDGALHSPDSCYHPNSLDLVVDVLGKDVPFPDMGFYESEPKLWLTLFEQCGIKTSPGSQDLAVRISELMEEVKKEGVSTALAEALPRIANHIFANWSDHADMEIETTGGGRTPFADLLKSWFWLPAASGRELERFLVGVEPVNRLYQPAELFENRAGYLIASLHPVISSTITRITSSIAHVLGVKSGPEWKEVGNHFERLLETIDANPLSDDSLKSFKRPLSEIYSYFGQNCGKFLEGPSGNPVKERFREKLCVLVPHERKFFKPREIYTEADRRLSPLIRTYKSDDSNVDKGLAVLGRGDRPNAKGLAEALVEAEKNQEQPLPEEWVSAINHALQLIAEETGETDAQDSALPFIRVLNARCELVPPNDVIYNNDPTLFQDLNVKENLLLHLKTPTQIVHLWGIARLSDAVATPTGKIEPSNDNRFVQLCAELEEVLRSPQFRQGIARIVQHQRGATAGSLDWLRKKSVRPCRRLKCSYTIALSGQPHELGHGETDVYSQPSSRKAGNFYLAETCAGVMYDRFAEAVCRMLDEDAPQDRAPLVAILQRKPGEIAKHLDRLRIGGHEQDEDHEQAGDEKQAADDFYSSGVDANEEEPDDLDATATTRGAIAAGGSPNRGTAKQRQEADDDDSDETSGDWSGGESEEISSGSKGTLDGRSRRKPRQTNVREHQRMLPGDGSEQGDREHEGRRRKQDGFWISRPATQEQVEKDRVEDDSGDDESRGAHAVAKAAVGFVMQFERSEGRKPQNMAHANPGYDIESKNGRVIERYIEVKGVDGDWGRNGVPLSDIQFRKAQEFKEKFWLYVVENCLEPEKRTLVLIQNPAAKTNQFRFDHGWRNAGEVKKPRILQPLKDRWLVDHSEGEAQKGKIIKVTLDQRQYWLEVRFNKIEPATSVPFDPITMDVSEK